MLFKEKRIKIFFKKILSFILYFCTALTACLFAFFLVISFLTVSFSEENTEDTNPKKETVSFKKVFEDIFKNLKTLLNNKAPERSPEKDFKTMELNNQLKSNPKAAQIPSQEDSDRKNIETPSAPEQFEGQEYGNTIPLDQDNQNLPQNSAETLDSKAESAPVPADQAVQEGPAPVPADQVVQEGPASVPADQVVQEGPAPVPADQVVQEGPASVPADQAVQGGSVPVPADQVVQEGPAPVPADQVVQEGPAPVPADQAVQGGSVPVPADQGNIAPSDASLEVQSYMAPFVYDSVNQKDPFKDPTHQAKEEAKEDKTVVFIPKTPPEEHNLDSIHLKGIIWDTNKPRSLFKLPSGDYYTLLKGDKIGKNGVIFEIRENEVIVIETDVVGTGDSRREERTIKIKKINRMAIH